MKGDGTPLPPASVLYYRAKTNLRGLLGGRVQGQIRQSALIDDDDDAARDDDAGADNEAQGRRGGPENPIDGEGPEDGGVLERADDRGRRTPKGVRQPHLTQCSGDADSDEPNPVRAEHGAPVTDGQ